MPTVISPNTTIEIVLPEGLSLLEGSTLLTKDLKEGEEVKLSVRVKAVAEGSWVIRGSAISKTNTRIFGGSDFLYLTIHKHNSSVSKTLRAQSVNTPTMLLNMSEKPKTSENTSSHQKPGLLTVYGYWFYYEEDGNTLRPARYIKVELYDQDPWGSTLLATTSTDANGFYQFPAIENNDGAFEDGYDIYIRAYSESEAAKVVNDLGFVYYGDTDKHDNVPDGLHYMGVWAFTGENRGAWSILNTIIFGYQYAADTLGHLHPRVTIFWPSGRTYCEGGDGYKIHFVREDQWDEDVILHEYGHSIQYNVYRGWIPNAGGEHTWNQHTNPNFAYSEGWATFFGVMVAYEKGFGDSLWPRDTVYRDTWDQYIYHDLETDPHEPGDDVEGAIACLLWDIYDGHNDGRDVLSLGISRTWDVFKNYKVSGHNAYNIHEFWDGWFSRGHDYAREMWSIFYDHGINKDNTPPSNPTSYTSSPPANQWSSSNTVSVTYYGASDDLSGINGYWYRWTKDIWADPTGYGYTTLTSITSLLSDGIWYLSLRSRDNAGNDASGYVYYGPFKIDTTPPDTPSLSESHCGSSWTTHNSPYFAWNDPGDGAGSGVSYYEGSMDDGAPFQVSSPYHPTLSDGIHTFKVRAVDGVGLRGSWSNVITVKIDTTPPAGIVTINEGAAYTNSPSVALTLSAVDGRGSGVAYMCFSNDGSSWSSWEFYAKSKQWTLTYGDGEKRVYVKYRDYVGLESSPSSDTIILDTTPPTTPIQSSPSDGARVNLRPTFNWAASSDSTSGVASYTLEIDTDPSFNTASLRRITGITATSYTLTEDLSVGTWYWRVRAHDNAGNAGSFSPARRIIVDRIKITSGGVSDCRLDVDAFVTVWFGVVYESDGMIFDSSKGTVYIDGKAAQWSSSNSRWELSEAQSTVRKKSYSVTGVSDSGFGLTNINDVAGPQEVIWDRIKITSYKTSDDRANVNSTQLIFIDAVYEYDNTPFTAGVLKINNTDAFYNASIGMWITSYSSNKVGKTIFKVTSVHDFVYNLTVFYDPNPPPEIVWDRIKVDSCGAVSERVNVNSSGLIYFTLKYEYDDSPVNDGIVILNASLLMTWNPITSRWEFNDTLNSVGKRTYYVTSVRDNKYNITALNPETLAKSASIIWDRIRITSYEVSDGRADVGSSQKVYVTAIYEYDGKSFTEGELYVNNSLATYNESLNKWVATVNSSNVGRTFFKVSSVRCGDLSLMYDDLPPPSIVWDRIKIYEWGAMRANLNTRIAFDLTHGQDIIYGCGDYPRYIDMLRANGYDVTEIRSTITDIWNSFEGYLMGSIDYEINVETNVDRLVVKVEWNASCFAKIELYDPNGHLIQIGRGEVHAHNPSLGKWTIRLYSSCMAYYKVFVGTGPDPFPEFLRNADVLIVFEQYHALPYVVNNYCPIYFSFSSQEAEEVNYFVRKGGSLFAGTEFRRWLGERITINDLLQGFAIRFVEGSVCDPSNNSGAIFWPLIYNFADHEITRGMTPISYRAGSGIKILDTQRARALAWSDEDSWLDLPPANEVYDSGEPFGNIAVLAYSTEDCGHVVAYGDAGLMPGELFLRIVHWLSESKQSFLVNTGDKITLWCRAEYEFDGLPFNSTGGLLYINNSRAVWSDARARWEYNYTSNSPAELEFTISLIQDRLYGLTTVDDASGRKTVTWTELNVGSVVILPAPIMDTGLPASLYAEVIWAHNGSAIKGALVALNFTLANAYTNSTGWVGFLIEPQNIVTQLVYSITPLAEPTGQITKYVAALTRITWTELVVSEVRVDKQITNTGDPINIFARIVWAHNGSASVGASVGINSSSTVVTTNSSGWAKIPVINDYVTEATYNVKAIRDARGYVTKSNNLSTPRLTWTELLVTDMFSDKSLLSVGDYATIMLHAIWAHNSSSLMGAIVSVDGVQARTNQTGWATLLVTKNMGGTYILVGKVLSDASGLVTKCIGTKNLSIAWTALRVDEMRWDRDFVNIGDTIRIYVHLAYAHNLTSIAGGSVVLNGTVATTNSTGWAVFNVSASTASSYVYLARGLKDKIGWITVADNNQSHIFTWTAINISSIISSATILPINSTAEIIVRAVWAHNGSAIASALVILTGNSTVQQAYTNGSGYAKFYTTASEVGEYLYNATGGEAHTITKALESKSIRIRFGIKSYVKLNLKKGYNLVALPLLNESLTASSLLKLIGNASQSIFMFNSSTQTWISYDKKLVEFGIPQPDFKIEPNTGYFVYAANDTSFTVVGVENVFRRVIPLRRGYNLIGWTFVNSSRVTLAFMNFSCIDSVFMFDATSQKYVSYDRKVAEFGIPQPDFEIVPGQGYFVFANKEESLYFAGDK